MNTIINLLKRVKRVRCITITGKNREYKKTDLNKTQISKRDNFVAVTKGQTCLSKYFACVSSLRKN